MKSKKVCHKTLTSLDNTFSLPEGPERPEQPEDAEDGEDLGAAGGGQGDDQVDPGDEDQAPVHHVPAAVQVGVRAQDEPLGQDLDHHLQREDRHEDEVGDGQELPLLRRVGN